MTDPGHWLAGRVAVVTGASRGIGAATAAALAGGYNIPGGTGDDDEVMIPFHHRQRAEMRSLDADPRCVLRRRLADAAR